MYTEQDPDNDVRPLAWLTLVTPGTLDRRILDQTDFWVDVTGHVHRVPEMNSAHLFNVLSLLRENAPRLHLEAAMDSIFDLLKGTSAGTPGAGEQLAYELTGRSIADCQASEWLETTPLVRAMRREFGER